MDYENEETKQKSVRIPIDLCEIVENEAKKENRDFSKQLNYIIKQYYEMKKILNNH
jgi:hypothetical protein